MDKEKLFSVTAKDIKWEYYRASGNGGQNRNKRDTAVRCTHEPSGAIGNAADERSQNQNKKLAFRRMVNSKKFQDWLIFEAARITGTLKNIEENLDG